MLTKPSAVRGAEPVGPFPSAGHPLHRPPRLAESAMPMSPGGKITLTLPDTALPPLWSSPSRGQSARLRKTVWVPCWCEVQALPMAGAWGHLVDIACVPLNSTPIWGSEAGKPRLDLSRLCSLWDGLSGLPFVPGIFAPDPDPEGPRGQGIGITEREFKVETRSRGSSREARTPGDLL